MPKPVSWCPKSSGCSRYGAACQMVHDAASCCAFRQRLHDDMQNGLKAGLRTAPPDNVHPTSAVVFVDQMRSSYGP